MQRGSGVDGDPGAYIVKLNKIIGTQGEKAIKIIVKPQTCKLLTAYPVKM